jgi:hypothetical protein
MNIVLTASFNKGIFCNGLQQNIIFLADMLKEMGYNPIICLNHEINKSIDCPANLLIVEKKELLEFDDIDFLLQTGWVVDNKTIDFIKIKNPKMKNVHVHYGNRMLADVEQASWDTVSVGTHKVDEVWISPHYEISTNYFKTFYQTERVFILPYIWSSKYIDIHENIWNKAGLSCKYDPESVKKIGIVEPNLNITKSCIPAIMLVEEYYNSYFSSFDRLNVYCSSRIRDAKYFKSLMWNLNIIKDKKVTFCNREKISKVFSNDCNVIVSHQLLNALNYTYLEALHFNIPLVHNSEYIKDAGYYYPDYDTKIGSKALSDALSFHDSNLEKYAKKAEAVLYRYSPKNPKVRSKYEKLFK